MSGRPIPITVYTTQQFVVGPPAKPVTLTNSQLWTNLAVIGTRPTVVFDAEVDSGAMLSFIGSDLWSRFERRIEWLAPESQAGLPSWLRSMADASGRSVRARLGRVRVKLAAVVLDRGVIESDPFDLVAMFARPGCLRSDDLALLGLNGGVHDRMRLVVEPGLAAARFEQLL